MSGIENKNCTTTIKAYKDSSRTVIFNLDRFAELAAAFNQDQSRSLFEAAQTDPTEVYSFLRAAIANGATKHAMNVCSDGMILADKQLDDEADVRQIAEQAVYDILPAAYEGSRVLKIAIAASSEDMMMGFTEPNYLMELQVTPPDLAA